jgi:hypothetical protein
MVLLSINDVTGESGRLSRCYAEEREVTVPNGLIILSAGLALCFGCFAQSELPQPLGSKSLSHVQLIEGFKPAVNARDNTPAGGSTRARPIAPTPDVRLRKLPLVMPQVSRAFPGGRCAHIILKSPPPDLDTKLVLKAPENRLGPIRTFRGLPQCLEDVR